MTAAPASKHICTAGMEALMRVSSVMLPRSSWGTLRSARIKTRFPLSRPAAASSLRRFTLKRVSGMRMDKFSGLRGILHSKSSRPLTPKELGCQTVLPALQ